MLKLSMRFNLAIHLPVRWIARCFTSYGETATTFRRCEPAESHIQNTPLEFSSQSIPADSCPIVINREPRPIQFGIQRQPIAKPSSPHSAGRREER
jgi:hypothetical protein